MPIGQRDGGHRQTNVTRFAFYFSIKGSMLRDFSRQSGKAERLFAFSSSDHSDSRRTQQPGALTCRCVTE
jgi:hypothetical protein